MLVRSCPINPPPPLSFPPRTRKEGSGFFGHGGNYDEIEEGTSMCDNGRRRTRSDHDAPSILLEQSLKSSQSDSYN